jgi:sulfite reductase (NADPH) hemoprotein beta-component
VPQYFVMVGGGADAEGASFGRVAAKIPGAARAAGCRASRGLYQAERRTGERLADFFRRADVARVKRLLADLERSPRRTRCRRTSSIWRETTRSRRK